ncbi:family 43 glycosylhydrolase [Zunongwangia atlantica]|uniref:Alpha-N-arabinofuranosidase n=1 Tax=Zunongwangia atlantica 22II14-10F7 TaxID=1185767 RepID=A0A1Y1T181_9FLAO|nr:family 43 glycosylhydrolase [Zunongwangia atlantica]ORL44747.1 alpha-N-arabinofuranosidase [Zunongwangia atlantica 22II14-10F7]
MQKIHSLHLFMLFFCFNAFAQNPLIMDQFTADPTARVFDGRLYVYLSHDIVPPKGEGRTEWFNMADYHVFSSENLIDWVDHGKILDQKDVPWADSKAYSMWAPDAIKKDDKYYFFFPTRMQNAGEGEGGFSIGVAIAEQPEGPYKIENNPINGVEGIDPNVFIDKDGQVYLYWSQSKIYGAKLKDNMIELDSKIKTFDEIPKKGHIEGPFVFERGGIYYMTYPHVANNIERLEYAVSDNPMGPFTHKGVIMDESESGTWTNHHSIVDYKNQWYLFYHDNDLSPDFDKNRSIRADSLFFRENGDIKKVIPTKRGVGITVSTSKIQIDRYSAKSNYGVAVVFLDRLDPFRGWKAVLNKPDAWIRYNRVDFGSKAPKNIKIRARSLTGGTIALKLAGEIDQEIMELSIHNGGEWDIFNKKIKYDVTAIQDLILQLKSGDGVEIDWLQFER